MTRRMPSPIVSCLTIMILIAQGTGAATAGDNHAGYYYPEPQSKEVYVSALGVMPTTSKRSRVGLMVGLNSQQLNRAYSPAYHIFAKGHHAEKMIVVATRNGQYDTIYRMRALLAALTSQARTSPLFAQSNQPENLNFFDLARMAGFTQLTISDGDKFSHQINLLSEN
jgi:hypothetical protein